MNTGASNSAKVFPSILHSISQISSLINSKESVQGTVVSSICILNGLSFHLKTSIITLCILFMVFYYCSVYAGYQQLYCSKNEARKHSRYMHDSEGGTNSGIVIYEVQSVFCHKFAQVCKNPNVILFSLSYHLSFPRI